MLKNENRLTGLILTSTTFTLAICATITSSIILIILIHHWFHNRIKRDEKNNLYLCIHIYFSVLALSAILLSMNIRTLLGDLNGQSFDSSACIVVGYLTLIHVSAMYMSFVNQVSRIIMEIRLFV